MSEIASHKTWKISLAERLSVSCACYSNTHIEHRISTL